MRTYLFAVGCFFVPTALVPSGTLVAQEAAAPSPAQAWIEFSESGDAGWHVVWNKATSTPRAIYGPGLRLDAGATRDLEDARRRADNVLRTHADLLGTGESTFVELIGQRAGRTYVLVYDQVYKGVPVLSGRADVRVHDNGAVSMFGSRAVSIPKGFATDAKIGEQFAQALGYDRVGTRPGTRPTANRLVIWADAESDAATTPRLAWEIGIDAFPGLVYGKAYVDARTGAFIEYRSELYECGLGHTHAPRNAGESLDMRKAMAASLRAPSRRACAVAAVPSAVAPAAVPAAEAAMMAVTGTVMGWVNVANDGRVAPVNTPLPNVLVSIDGGASGFTDAAGNFTIASSSVTPVTVRVNLGAGRTRHAAGGTYTYEGLGNPFCNPAPSCYPSVNAAAAVQATQQVTPGGGPITLQLGTSAEFPSSQMTAYYHTDGINEYVRGVLGNTSQLATASNIDVYVNWGTDGNAFYGGNTINFFSAGGQYNNTAIKSVIDHEWGHGLDDRYGGISQTDGLSEGWGDIVAMYRNDDPVVGRGFATNGGSIRTGTNTRVYPVPSSSGVHTQGQVWMGFAWQVRVNLRSSLGVAAGTATAEQIVLASVVADATNQPDAVREVFILDDDDANLNNGVPHYAELSAAATARNLPFPEIQLGELGFTALASTPRQLTPRIVRVTDQAIGGSFTSVDMVFDAGAGQQTRPMVAEGAGYIALLPGVLSPQSVSYHFLATHSNGQVVRQPAVGEYSYSVGQESILFTDDFESGTNGWTSQQIARQDDWQFGTPAGRAGSGDPSAAFSGSNARGNDLGIGNFNGVYQNNVHNVLRSPTIDASGVTGVTLEYKRWLTVEKSQYDQAQIGVSGTTAWTNPFALDLIDTAWTSHTVPLPMLDQTTGQLEFRLTTDGGLVFGGWTIDDVRVFSFSALPAPAVQFTATPAQVPAGGSTTFDVQGTANATAAILLSDVPGPLVTPFPGLILEVGGALNSIPIQLDGSGNFQLAVPGHTDPALAGTLLYSQVVEISGGTVQGSNGVVILLAD